MSSCGGKCGCGSSCKCGNGCTGCGMYPDVEASSTATLIQGVASVRMYSEGSEMEFGAEGGPGNCKCGSSCKCGDDCKC